MQAAIHERWQRDNPLTWQLKHVRWFLTQYLKDHSDATRYYYLLTASLVWKRLGKDRDLVIAPVVCCATAYWQDDVRERLVFP